MLDFPKGAWGARAKGTATATRRVFVFGEKKLAFAQMAEGDRTVWIRTFMKHDNSRGAWNVASLNFDGWNSSL
jgi:hypothetical protein